MKLEIGDVMVSTRKADLQKKIKSKFPATHYKTVYRKRPNKSGSGHFWIAEIYKKGQ